MWASSSGRRVACSGSRSSQVASGGVVTRSSVISYNSDNGVIRPQPAQHRSAFQQLSGNFNHEFFMAKYLEDIPEDGMSGYARVLDKAPMSW